MARGYFMVREDPRYGVVAESRLHAGWEQAEAGGQIIHEGTKSTKAD
jgi:hypothetical protein